MDNSGTGTRIFGALAVGLVTTLLLWTEPQSVLEQEAGGAGQLAAPEKEAPLTAGPAGDPHAEADTDADALPHLAQTQEGARIQEEGAAAASPERAPSLPSGHAAQQAGPDAQHAENDANPAASTPSLPNSDGAASRAVDAEASMTARGAPGPEFGPVPEFDPVFDIVRVEPGGSAVAAGRARPGVDVEIFLDETVVSRVTAGRDGAFVSFFDVAPGGQSYRLIARAAEGGAAEGGVAPDIRPGAQGGGVYILAPDVYGEAPVIAQTSPDGPRLLQPAPGGNTDTVSLDAVSYDAEGNAIFSGRAAPGSEVRLYLDGAFLTGTDVNDDGVWKRGAKKALAPGAYTLRADQIGPSGTVESRIETSFKRDVVAAERTAKISRMIKEGDNLWRIAEAHYGTGYQYTLIFGANADAIRNPDLIYPGQIFILPEPAAIQ